MCVIVTGQLLGGETNPLGQGIRVNATKFLRVNEMLSPTYEILVNDEKVTFRFDKVIFAQKVRASCVYVKHPVSAADARTACFATSACTLY